MTISTYNLWIWNDDVILNGSSEQRETDGKIHGLEALSGSSDRILDLCGPARHSSAFIAEVCRSQ